MKNKKEFLYLATNLITNEQFYFYNFQTTEQLKISMPDFFIEKYIDEEANNV